MAKKWEELKARMSPESRAEVERRAKELLEQIPLAEVRRAIGLTQAQLGDTLDLGQPTVSKIENATDMYLSTLRRFVEALGGELKVVASFPGGREFIIDQFSAFSEPESGASGLARSSGPRQRRAAG